MAPPFLLAMLLEKVFVLTLRDESTYELEMMNQPLTFDVLQGPRNVDCSTAACPSNVFI